MIDKYFHAEEGYNPFLISKGWQIAQLNYLPTHGLDDIDSIEVHNQTDEAFILFEGTAVLIAAKVDGQSIEFEPVNMQKGVTYNIPTGVWHNIAMSRDAKMIIVERDNTHNTDVGHITLSQAQRHELYAVIKSVL